MNIDDQIRDEKLQYNINSEAAKISALSSGKFCKYEYLPGEDILQSNQQQIIEQAKFTYSPLGEAFDKQTKTIKDQGEKQVEAVTNNKLAIKDENITPKSAFGNEEAVDEFNKINKLEKNVDREKLVYNSDKYMYDFRTFKTIRTFGKDNLITETRPKNAIKKKNKEILLLKICMTF